ncbi:MAG: hypothetical protein QG630_434, partial [Patescibacteria group bacterium]|nr:hypothetical protein [Patescibacteria group bacterium]
SPPPPILLKMQVVYSLWHEYIIHFPKIHRYSLGAKIDSLFVEMISDISFAYFTNKNQKLIFVQRSIKNDDVLKILLNVAKDISALKENQYILLTEKLVEIGRILGGWHNQLLLQNEKENSQTKSERKI